MRQDNPMRSLLVGDKGVIVAAPDALTRLFRLFLYECNLGFHKWERLLEEYCTKCEPQIGRKRAVDRRGNLPKELYVDTITWRAFVRGMTALGFKDVKMTFELTKDDETKTYTIVIPKTYGDPKPKDPDHEGVALRMLWDTLMSDYPEIRDNLNKYIAAYHERNKDFFGSDLSGVKSNILRSLGVNAVTWSNLYRGLMIMDLDTIVISLEGVRPLNSRAHRPVASIKLVK